MPMDSIIQVLLFYSYLSERKQRTKIDSSFTCWAEILFGVPQGSILGPLLFNAYICDLFFEVRDLEYARFVNDTTSYSCLLEMIPILENSKKVYRVCLTGFQKTF